MKTRETRGCNVITRRSKRSIMVVWSLTLPAISTQKAVFGQCLLPGAEPVFLIGFRHQPNRDCRRCHFRTGGAPLKGAALISARSGHASSMIWAEIARTARARGGGWL